MPSLKQQAEMDAYTYRTSPVLEGIDLKDTEQGIRKTAESYAVEFVKEHSSEYEDIKEQLKNI